MPFACAKAVCATFCHHIAGALIPIFGPDFPSDCIRPEASEHSRMIIDPAIVAESTREARLFRSIYMSANSHHRHHHHHHQHQHHSYYGSSQGHGGNHGSRNMIPSPRFQRRQMRLPFQADDYDRSRLLFKRRMVLDSPHRTDTDGDGYSGPESMDREGRYMFSGIPPLRIPGGGWTPHNNQDHRGSYHHRFGEVEDTGYGGADPWLSAIPRSAGPPSPPNRRHPLPSHGYHPAPPPPPPLSTPPRDYHPHPWRGGAAKRSAEHFAADADCEYDAGESQGGSSSPATTSKGDEESGGTPRATAANNGVDKSAALLLMHLSVRDGDQDRATVRTGGCNSSPVSGDTHRNKRRRATSM